MIDAVLVDCREEEAYSSNHILDAVNIPYSKGLSYESFLRLDIKSIYKSKH
jgi:rhodanese-related sulfurtransferase